MGKIFSLLSVIFLFSNSSFASDCVIYGDRNDLKVIAHYDGVDLYEGQYTEGLPIAKLSQDETQILENVNINPSVIAHVAPQTWTAYAGEFSQDAIANNKWAGSSDVYSGESGTDFLSSGVNCTDNEILLGTAVLRLSNKI